MKILVLVCLLLGVTFGKKATQIYITVNDEYMTVAYKSLSISF